MCFHLVFFSLNQFLKTILPNNIKFYLFLLTPQVIYWILPSFLAHFNGFTRFDR